MSRRLLPALVPLLLCAFVARANAQGTAVMDPQATMKTLPEKSTLVFHVPSVAKLLAKVQDSPMYKAKDQKEFADLLSNFAKQIEGMRQEAKREANIDPVEMMEAVEGEMLVVLGDLSEILGKVGESVMNMSEPEITSELVPLMVSLDTGTKKETFKKNLQSLFAFIIRQGARVKTDTFKSGKISTLKTPDEDEFLKNIYVGEMGSRFVIGFNKSLIERTLAGLEGAPAGATLARNAHFVSSRTQTGASYDAFAFVNFRPLIEGIDGIMAENPFGFAWNGIREALFGASLNNMAMTTNLLEDGIHTRGFVHNSGASDGVLGWYKGKPIAPRAGEEIPADVLNFSAMSFNPKAMGNTVRKVAEVVTSVMSFTGETFDFEQAFEENLGVSYSSFMGSIGERLQMFTSPGADLGDIDPAMASLAGMSLVFDVKDEKPWNKVISKANEQTGGALQPKNYLNRELYVMDQSDSGPKPTLCVTDKRLLFSMDEKTVQKVIRRIGKDADSLNNKEEFKKATSKLPARVAMVSYTTREYFDQIATMMEKMPESPEFQGAEIPPELFQFLGAIYRCMDTAAGHGEWTDQGMLFDGKAPYRE